MALRLVKRKRNFAVRTIRGGQVRINGVVFKPKAHNFAYDGRLDGKRYVFGLYWVGPEWHDDFISLWGSEELQRCQDEEESRRLFHSDPMWVAGKAYWEWWEAEGVRKVSQTEKKPCA